MEIKKIKNKFSFLSFAQASYMTMDFFGQNDLGSHASACAFGFLLSFMPLVMMVFSILIMVAHASSEMLRRVVAALPFLGSAFSLDEMLNSQVFSGAFTIVQVFFGFWVFKMARNLFLYIQKGILRIFNTEAPKRTILNQVLVFAGEIILVLGAAALILITISLKTLKDPSVNSTIKDSIPPFLLSLLFKIVNILPYTLIFLTIFLLFKFYTGTKPPTKICFFSALLCTAIFIGVVVVLNIFLDFKKYSAIYGILGNLVILLFEVQIFFLLVFVFAQFIFVLQFFDDLLLAELYLLPNNEEKGLLNTLRRKLFISPDFLIKKFQSAKKFNQGETIVQKGSVSNTVYYIISGSIKVVAETETVFLKRGTVFGEAACLLNVPRTADCIANEECDILEIDGETFSRMVKLNGDVAKKAIGKLSVYLKQ